MRAASTLVTMPPVPTPARRSAPPDVDRGQIVLGADLGDPGGAGPARVAGVQRVHIGQQHEQVGVDEGGDERGEPVVVAEPDLVGRDRVVLVDDRHGPDVEELAQSPVGVAVVGPPGHVVDGEQHLADRAAVAREAGRVPADQQPLPDAGRGLLGGQVARTLGEAERGEPGGDRTGRDQHDLLVGGGSGGEHVDQGVDARGVEAAGRGGQRRRADLDDDPPGRRDCFAHVTHSAR